MKKTEVFFPFEPKPKGRPRFNTRTGRSYTPQETRNYEKKVAECYAEQTDDFYDCAIAVKLVFDMPIPASTSKKKKQLMATGAIKCTKHTGDADNLAKAILDGLNSLAFSDDCLITRLTVIKRYSTDGNVGTELTITEDVD